MLKLGTIGGGTGRSAGKRSAPSASFLPTLRTGYNAMAFQSAPDCAEAVVRNTLSGQQVNNVFNFRKAGGYTLTDLQQLADDVSAWWAASVMPNLCVSLIYTGCLVRGLEFEADQEAVAGIGTTPGSVSGIVAANNVAFVMTHRTGFTGRSSRGRTFLGGLAANDFDSSDSLNATRVGLLNVAFEPLTDFPALNGWEFVVLSRFHNGAKRLTATALAVTFTEARNRFTDSQRGRLPAGH